MATGPSSREKQLVAIHREPEFRRKKGNQIWDPQSIAENRTTYDSKTRGTGVQEPRSENK